MIVSSSTAIENVVTNILNFKVSIFYAAVSDHLANEVTIFIDKTSMEELKVVKQRILSLKSIRNLNTSFERDNHGAFRTIYNTLKNCTKGFLIPKGSSQFFLLPETLYIK